MPSAELALTPLPDTLVLKNRTYAALREAILAVDVYADKAEHRLDERQLAAQLGVSRTPVREALARLEHEGLVTIVPRRGAFVARKSKEEILDMITVWAALESMAARLATERASAAEIRSLRELFVTFEDAHVQARIDEYSATNIRFHQAILRLGKCALIESLTDNLFLHMRSIRKRTIGEQDRAARSIIDHMHIIEAIETRDAERAERLVRSHSLDLGAHVARHVDWLE